MLIDMKKILYFLFFMLAVLVTSCSLPNNVDPKHAEIIAADPVFTYAEVQLANQVGSINVNINTTRLLAQYQAEVTYPTESRYNFSDRQIPDAFFVRLYERVLMNLKGAYTTIDATAAASPEAIAIKANKLAVIEVLNVYAYQVLVDAFGNVPYTEALMGRVNSIPKYDDAYTIYMDLIARLDDAIANMDLSYDSFGDADVMYGGDMALWKEFAASLELRMGLRLADVSAANPSSIVTKAIAAGVFADQTESAIFTYVGVSPYVSSYYTEYVINARKDFNPTQTIVNLTNSLNDPRRAAWFTLYDDGVNPPYYKGETYGMSAAATYKNYSHFVPDIRTNPNYPVIFSDYVEVEFLLAEACERSLGGMLPADAEAHYNNAITASLTYWVPDITDAEIATYLTQPSVAYTTATGNYKQKIGTQKWLGLFDRGEEGWAEWRRLDYPQFNPPQAMTYADIPVRMPYPYNENKQNKANYTAAVTAMGGTDDATVRLFWDTHASPFITK
jgi:hypothetical protein